MYDASLPSYTVTKKRKGLGHVSFGWSGWKMEKAVQQCSKYDSIKSAIPVFHFPGNTKEEEENFVNKWKIQSGTFHCSWDGHSDGRTWAWMISTKKHAQLKQLLATWKEGTYSQVGDIPIEVSVGENFVEEIEEAPEDDNTQETPLQEDYAQDENTQEDVMNGSPPNLNGVSLPHPTKKRGRPKGSNKSVIGLPRKRFRTNMP